MAKSIPLTLSIEDHDRLESIVKARTLQAQVVTRARILLLKEGGDSVEKITTSSEFLLGQMAGSPPDIDK